ncbi:MAG: helix-turn-helix domain-containing protein [Elusimicrobiota bacterium]|jgi:transcriptional regulator with XRE-family HTH domain|nr:helix-turn-helix domain-containing protein [Elusimicrobiota bacterium]
MVEKKIKKEIGRRLAFFRNKNGLMQIDITDKLKVSKTVLSDWEVGRSLISIINLFKVCEILGITIFDILDFSKELKMDNKQNVKQNISHNSHSHISAHLTIENGEKRTRELTEMEIELLKNWKELDMRSKNKLLTNLYELIEKKENL